MRTKKLAYLIYEDMVNLGEQGKLPPFGLYTPFDILQIVFAFNKGEKLMTDIVCLGSEEISVSYLFRHLDIEVVREDSDGTISGLDMNAYIDGPGGVAITKIFEKEVPNDLTYKFNLN